MREEMAAHLALRAADLEREGLAPAEAQRRARLEFGATEHYKEECREAAGYRLADELGADLRDAARALRRNPGFTAIACAVLGLVLAADLVAFAFADAWLLRPLPFDGAQRHVELVVTAGDQRQTALERERGLRLLQGAASVLDQGYVFDDRRFTIGGAVPRRAHAAVVSGGYFDLLRPAVAHGRAFGPRAGLADSEPVLVLSHSGWQRLADAAPDVIGRSLLVDGVAFTVVGVLAESVTGLEPVVPDFWLPAPAAERLLAARGEAWTYAVGALLRPGATAEQAAAALTAALRAEPGTGPRAAFVESRTTLLREGRDLAPLTASLILAFVLVTAVAAANLTGLHLARAAARRRDVALRAALGASRARLLRPLLVEGVLVGLLAFGLAWALSSSAIAGLQGAMFSLVTQAGMVVSPVAISARVAVAGAVVGLAVAVLGSLLPALQATRVDLRSGFTRDGAWFGGRVSAGRLRGGLVVAQVAASVILLVGAGLIARNAARADDLDVGFELAGVVDLNAERADPALAERLRERPDVRGAGASLFTPLAGFLPRVDATVDGTRLRLGFNAVDANFFDTLGIALRRGRGLAAADAGTAVVVVSENTARLLWPGRDPLGRTLELELDEAAPRRFEVVGVVADVASGFFFQGRDTSAVYLPGRFGEAGVDNLLVRVAGDAHAALPPLREACATEGLLCEPWTLADLFGRQRVPFTVLARIALGLGSLALGLACLGLHGQVAFAVAQATREIGVRMALGATRGGVLGSVLGDAARRAAIGIALGALPCLALSALLASRVPQLQAFDAFVYALVPLALLAAATAAALPPALRAASVDPLVALREE